MISKIFTGVEYLKYLLYKPSIYNIMWLNYAVTYRCNSRCLMCSIWETKTNPELEKEELTLEEIGELLKSPLLKNLNGINFTGGEAFLRSDIVDLIGTFIKKYPRAFIGVASNGFNSKSIVEKVKEIKERYAPKQFRVCFSMDGLFEKHDQLRGVPGAFERVNRSIELLKAEKINIGVDFTITPWNHKDLLSVYQYANEKNIKFTASFAHHSEYYNNVQTRFDWGKKDLDDIQHSLKTIAQEELKRESLPKKIVDPNLYFLLHCVRHQENKRMDYKCYSGTHSLLLDPYGNVFPCVILGRKMGNIKEMDFDHIWLSKEAEAIRESIKTDKCRCWVGCDVLPSMLRNCNAIKWNLKNKFLSNFNSFENPHSDMNATKQINPRNESQS